MEEEKLCDHLSRLSTQCQQFNLVIRLSKTSDSDGDGAAEVVYVPQTRHVVKNDNQCASDIAA
eukprot:4633433-Pyramimonas_sp.AAC.1